MLEAFHTNIVLILRELLSFSIRYKYNNLIIIIHLLIMMNLNLQDWRQSD